MPVAKFELPVAKYFYRLPPGGVLISAGNRWNFTGRALAEISERLIDNNRLFGSLPEVNYH